MSTKRPQSPFIRSIIGDVAAAIHRTEVSKTDESRRSAIRTVSAAVEGMVWHYREHVIWAATELDVLSDGERLALLEITPSIDAHGRLHNQPRYVTTLSLLRFLARIAERITSDNAITFDDNQWKMLNDTIKVRNRITHPKSERDVIVTNSDTNHAFAAFHWLCQQIIKSMDALIAAMTEHSANLWHVLSKLRDEDPFYMAEYRRIQSLDG